MITMAAGYFNGIMTGSSNFGFGPGAPTIDEDGHINIPIANPLQLHAAAVCVTVTPQDTSVYAGYELELDGSYGPVLSVTLLSVAEQTLEHTGFCLKIEEITART